MAKKKKKKRGRGGKTRHHIVPLSRGGKNEWDNIAEVKKKWHDKYHSLFSNKTPEEILEFLVEVFWNGKTKFIKNYMEGLCLPKEK